MLNNPSENGFFFETCSNKGIAPQVTNQTSLYKSFFVLEKKYEADKQRFQYSKDKDVSCAILDAFPKNKIEFFDNHLQYGCQEFFFGKLFRKKGAK